MWHCSVLKNWHPGPKQAPWLWPGAALSKSVHHKKLSLSGKKNNCEQAKPESKVRLGVLRQLITNHRAKTLYSLYLGWWQRRPSPNGGLASTWSKNSRWSEFLKYQGDGPQGRKKPEGRIKKHCNQAWLRIPWKIKHFKILKALSERCQNDGQAKK